MVIGVYCNARIGSCFYFNFSRYGILLLCLHLLVEQGIASESADSRNTMGYLNSILQASKQVHAADDGPVSGGGLRSISLLCQAVSIISSAFKAPSCKRLQNYCCLWIVLSSLLILLVTVLNFLLVLIISMLIELTCTGVIMLGDCRPRRGWNLFVDEGF